MAEQDLREKHLFYCNDVFATLWNGLVFKRPKEAIRADLLEDAPTEYVDIPKRAPLKRVRDVMKYCKGRAGLNIALFGLENQTAEDASMIGRIMCYDALAYRHQLSQTPKGRKILPVFTAVVYFGYNARWDGARCLRDIVRLPVKWRRHFSDYRIRVIELAWLTDEEINALSGDMKAIAVCLRKFRLKELDHWPDTEIEHISEVLDLLGDITGNSWFSDIKDDYASHCGRVKMCEMFEKYNAGLIAVGEKRGLERGKAEGMAIGEKRGLERGKAEGIAIGEKRGLERGKAEGIAEGMVLGEKRGKFEGSFNRLIDMTKRIMVQLGKTLEDAMAYLRLTDEEKQQVRQAF